MKLELIEPEKNHILRTEYVRFKSAVRKLSEREKRKYLNVVTDKMSDHMTSDNERFTRLAYQSMKQLTKLEAISKGWKDSKLETHEGNLLNK